MEKKNLPTYLKPSVFSQVEWRLEKLKLTNARGEWVKKLDFKVRAILELKNYGGAIKKTWSVGRKGPKTYQAILKCLLKWLLW